MERAQLSPDLANKLSVDSELQDTFTTSPLSVNEAV